VTTTDNQITPILTDEEKIFYANCIDFNRPKLSDLYVIQDTENKRIKIGQSFDPFSRLKALNTGASSSLILIRVYKEMGCYEKEIHKTLKKFKIRPSSEWFSKETFYTLKIMLRDTNEKIPTPIHIPKKPTTPKKIHNPDIFFDLIKKYVSILSVGIVTGTPLPNPPHYVDVINNELYLSTSKIYAIVHNQQTIRNKKSQALRDISSCIRQLIDVPVPWLISNNKIKKLHKKTTRFIVVKLDAFIVLGLWPKTNEENLSTKTTEKYTNSSVLITTEISPLTCKASP